MEENEFHQRQPLLSVDSDSVDGLDDSSLSPRVRNGSAVKIEIEMGDSLGGCVLQHQDPRPPGEGWKTVVALLFVLLNFILTTASLSITHELRDPSMQPLPDILLDSLPYRAWALDLSEVLIMFGVLVAAFVTFSHKQRWVLVRRISLVVGTLYGYRAVTMLVTSLPSANTEYHCTQQLNHTITPGEVVHRVLKIMSGVGLSMYGQHVYCGDWIFSGHTMILVLSYLIVEHYTDARIRLICVLQWLLLVCAWLGVALLLISRGHYTVDVVIAYYVTSRLWYMHNMYIIERLRESSSQASSSNGGNTPMNFYARLWWARFASWLEENVRGEVVPSFQFPVPVPATILGFQLKAVQKPRTRDI